MQARESEKWYFRFPRLHSFGDSAMVHGTDLNLEMALCASLKQKI